MELTEEKEKIITHQVITLNFDCYQFYKFIECIEKYVDEIEFFIENREFAISFMDASRIMLCKCSKELDRLTTIEKMKFGVSTSDLMTLLKTRKSDLKDIELSFDNTKTYIELIKTSRKLNSSKITRTLNLLDLDLELVPMENLNKIEYKSKADFPTRFLDDFFYESGIYSEIVDIEINENIGLSFTENGQIGNSIYLIKSEYCNEIKGFERGSYSYSFLTPIKPLLSILDNKDKIVLHLKNDNPIKLEINLSSLDMNFLIYLAPRVEEAEFDDDDDFDEYDNRGKDNNESPYGNKEE